MDYSSPTGRSLTVKRFLDKYGHSALKIKSSQTVTEAAAAFADSEHGRRYSMAAVVDDGDRVCGVLSLGDIVFALAQHREHLFEMSVASIMTKDPHTATLNDDLLQVLQRMAELEVRHMPVVEDGVLLGLVTRKDALEGLYHAAALEIEDMTHFVFRSGARY